jgi:hypothetical protein
MVLDMNKEPGEDGVTIPLLQSPLWAEYVRPVRSPKGKVLRCAVPVLLFLASASQAGDWFLNVGAPMGRIEPAADGSTWLMRPFSDQSAVSVTGMSGSTCLITQIHLIPSAGQEKAWLATLLAAWTAGKRIAVYADCVASSSRLDATRLVIEN